MSEETPEHYEEDNDCMNLLTAYLHTTKGKIMAAEIVMCLVITVCYAASWSPGYMGFAVSEFIYCVILFLLFATKYDQQFPYVHWGWTDFIRSAIGCGLFFIFSLIYLARGFTDSAGTVGAIFGFIAAVLFGYDCFLSFPKVRKQNAPAPGDVPAGSATRPYHLPEFPFHNYDSWAHRPLRQIL